MVTEVYIQDFPIDLAFSLPFKQIFDLARKRRFPNKSEIEKEVMAIAFKNKDEIVDLLSNSLLKAMNEDIRLGEISNDTTKELNTKISYLNNQFKSVNDYFESLDAEDQRDLLLPFIEKELNTLIDYKNKFERKLISKSEWDDNDSIIYTYYSVYQETIAVYRGILKKANRIRIGSVLNVIKTILFFYKPILLVYMLGKPLENDIVLERLSELRANINPAQFYIITDPKRRAIIEALVSSHTS
ncbi:MAG: hypothetical protein M1382_01395 [Candidatus Marsarchaeota archaeon]|nr:hypothetical protein [Candidatus Marsarchaeota archaeon]